MKYTFSIYRILAVALFLTGSFSYALDEEGRTADLQILKKSYSGRLVETQLVPKGFVAAGSAKGDLNGDGNADAALIVHRVPKDEAFDLPQFVVVFLGTADKHYELWKLGDHHFTNSMPNQMSENGLQHLEIEKGVLTFASDFAMSMGGWSAGGCTQKWRNNKTGFELIGLTVESTNRQCGDCGTYTDTNFVTRKQFIKKVSEDPENPKTTTRTKKIKEGPISWENFDYDKRCYEE